MLLLQCASASSRLSEKRENKREDPVLFLFSRPKPRAPRKEVHFVLGSCPILFTSSKEPDMEELKSDLLAAKEEITAFQTEKKESVRLYS